MSIELGSGSINEIRLGATEIKKVYLGSNLIYDKTFSYLYDIEPFFYGISAARQLRSGQTLVERDRRTDNTEADISFIANEKTLSSPSTVGTTLGGFVGSGDAFANNPYDQSGANFIVEQSIANDQPQSVSSGALVTSVGKPAWDNTNSSGWKSSSNFDLSAESEVWFFAVAELETLGGTVSSDILGIGNTTGGASAGGGLNKSIRLGFAPAGNLKLQYRIGNNGLNYFFISNEAFADGRYLMTVKLKANSPFASAAQIWVNGNALTRTSQGSNDTTGLPNLPLSVLFADRTPQAPLNGKAQEILIYKGNQSANRAAIEADINAYYNIY